MNRIIHKFFIACFLIIGCVNIAMTQTFHAIVACNTIDSNIGVGMVADMENMSNAIQIIAAHLDCEFEMEVFDGQRCTKANLTNYINEMNVKRDDVVMFFYGGHGTHALNNPEDPWPQMCMNTNIESLFMPVLSVEQLIAAKQPKLSIIMTNCCNKEQLGITIKPLYAQSTGATMLSDYNVAAFKKLFLEFKGKVIMTSSKLGQYSWCGANGGLFTNYLLDVLDAVGKDQVSADWESVCKATHDKTLACDNLPGGAKQEPFYVVKETTEKKNIDKHDYTDINELFEALQTLVNKNINENGRLDMIPSVLSRHFAPGAKVKTVGRNGTTVIDYEDANVFLRRIVQSPFIKQINVLKGEKTGRNSSITVHEVRTN